MTLSAAEPNLGPLTWPRREGARADPAVTMGAAQAADPRAVLRVPSATTAGAPAHHSYEK
jgi:hypothetical protein